MAEALAVLFRKPLLEALGADGLGRVDVACLPKALKRWGGASG